MRRLFADRVTIQRQSCERTDGERFTSHVAEEFIPYCLVQSHDGTAIVSDRLAHFPQTLRRAESRSMINQLGLLHGKICDWRCCHQRQQERRNRPRHLHNDRGQLRYAVENEGALDFVEEARLSPSPKNDLAA
jgi:hypothetical protein